MDDRTIDLAIVATANLVNLLMTAVFLARSKNRARLEHALGIIIAVLAIPVVSGAVLNASIGRPWWTVLLLVPFLVFCGVELVLDYVLKMNFRQTALLWPYLSIYYVAVLALMGYAFGVAKPLGIITLATYLLSQLAAWYAHSGVRERAV